MSAKPGQASSTAGGPERPDREGLAQAAEDLSGESSEAILRWAVEVYHPRLAVVSNFGPGTVALIHQLSEVCADVPVVHIDTGFEFAETEELGKQLVERYGIVLKHVRPDLTVEQQAAQYGEKLYARDPNYCCYMRKVLPLAKGLAGFDAWVTGIRASQTAERGQAKTVEWDSRHDKVKVNPLLSWTSEQVWDFIREHEIPYNSLHDRGYASIGCWPCTRAVKDDEPERAGRWSAFGKTECGLHVPHDSSVVTNRKG